MVIGLVRPIRASLILNYSNPLDEALGSYA
jgi:hypothetical protein